MYSSYYSSVRSNQALTAKRQTSVFAEITAMQPGFRAVAQRSSFFNWCGALLLALVFCQAAMAAVTPDATVRASQQTPSSLVTSPALSTISANELLLAYVTADSQSTPNTTVQKVTGGGLTWVLVVRTNAQSGTSEIWRAFSPTALKGITVSATLSQTVVSSITVQSYSGVLVSGTNGSGAIGAVASGHGSSGGPTASLVTTQNSSMVVGVGNDYDNAIARVPMAGQAVMSQDLTSTGDTYWVQRLSALTPTKGTRVTLGDSAPTGDQYNLSICEILPAASQQLSLSASTLAFGSVTDGTSKALSLTLTSSGTAAVAINSAAITGTGFSLGTTGLPKTLTPGQTLSIPVTFAPTTAGALTGSLTINSNATGSPTSTVTLSGTGVGTTPQLSLSASTIAFGSVTNATSKALSLTLTSSGTAAVTINSAAITGTGFSLGTTGLPKTLTPGQTLSIPVTFAPTTAGAVTGKITINSNATGSPTSTVTLSGTGVATTQQLSLSASTLAFGSVTDGTSKALSLTLTSSGTATVTINSAAITGTGFSLGTTGLPKTLTPGQTLSIPVTFAPTTAGALTGNLTISSNATGSPTSTVTLSGTGVATTQQLSLSASTLAFGSVTNATSKALSLTLTSSGTAAVTINSAAITGTGFSLGTTGLPKTLTPGQTLSIPVTFAPTTAGAVTGKITINSNATSSPTSTVTLSGTGVATTPQLSLSASTLAFGSVTDGTSKSLTLLLTSSGTSAVTVNSAAITGAGYSIASGGSFPMTLAPQQTLTLTIAFEPTVVGAATGTLTLASTSSTGNSTAALTGTGTALPYTVDLSWSAPASSTDPVAGYHIYRATGSSAMGLVSAGTVTQTSYVDTSVTNGITYTYEVKSVDGSGVESTSSNTFVIAIPAS